MSVEETLDYLCERLAAAEEAHSAASAARQECWLAYSAAKAAEEECKSWMLRLRASITALKSGQSVG